MRWETAAQVRQDHILQVDGYNPVFGPKTNSDIKLAYCWAHARRKLLDLTQSNAAPLLGTG